MDGRKLIASNLRYFTTLYRLKSVSEAARAIPISYQGLRKSIRILEEDLDVSLFEQTAAGKVAPTPYADALYSLVQEWVVEIGELSNAFDAIRSKGVETIDLACPVGFGDIIGHDFPRHFNAKYSEYHLSVIEYPDDAVDSMLLDGYFSVAVVTAPFSEGYEVKPLCTLKSCCWMSNDNPLASRHALVVSDLNEQDITLPGDHNKTGAYYASLIEAGKLCPSSITYCSNLFHSFLFAASGKGIGLGVTLPDEIGIGFEHVVAIPLDDGFDHTFAFAHRNGFEESHSHSVLERFLKSELRSKHFR